MNLLKSHHRHGRRFRPLDFTEAGDRVAVRVAVTDPNWSDEVETFKVFTFHDDKAVLLQDAVGEEYAHALLHVP
ncbi:MAG: hypothetical protein ACRDLM_09970 [Gaiellaceae bacterium]